MFSLAELRNKIDRHVEPQRASCLLACSCNRFACSPSISVFVYFHDVHLGAQRYVWLLYSKTLIIVYVVTQSLAVNLWLFISLFGPLSLLYCCYMMAQFDNRVQMDSRKKEATQKWKTESGREGRRDFGILKWEIDRSLPFFLFPKFVAFLLTMKEIERKINFNRIVQLSAKSSRIWNNISLNFKGNRFDRL